MTRSAHTDLLAMVLAFAVVTALAELLGAPNLGTAMTFGQLAFGLTATAVLVRP